MALAGLVVESHGGETSSVRARRSPSGSRSRSALLLVTVKAPQLEEALERVDPDAVDEGVVIPLLNGLEHMEPLRERFDGRVAAGSISRFEAYRAGRVQIVEKTPRALVTIASDDLPGQRGRARAELASAARIDVGSVRARSACSGTRPHGSPCSRAATALTRKSVGELRADPEWRPRIEDAIDEACAIAAADGVALHALRPVDDHRRDGRRNLTTSAARDVAAGRPSELDAIAGAVVRAGERLGVPVPGADRARGRAPASSERPSARSPSCRRARARSAFRGRTSARSPGTRCLHTRSRPRCRAASSSASSSRPTPRRSPRSRAGTARTSPSCVPPSTRPRRRRTSSGSRSRSSGSTSDTTCSRSCARRTRSAARTPCAAASSSSSPRPRPTRSARSSS